MPVPLPPNLVLATLRIATCRMQGAYAINAKSRFPSFFKKRNICQFWPKILLYMELLLDGIHALQVHSWAPHTIEAPDIDHENIRLSDEA